MCIRDRKPEEVATLDELRTRADERGALILADPQRVEAELGATAAWIGAGAHVLLVGVVPDAEAEETLKRLPCLHALISPPVTAGRLRLKLERAIELLHGQRVNQQLDGALLRKTRELHELNKIGVALSAERDVDKLLDLILAKCREITAADAGSLYLVERGKDHTSTDDDRLRFKLPQNDSVMVPFEELSLIHI